MSFIREIHGSLYLIDKRDGRQSSEPLAVAEARLHVEMAVLAEGRADAATVLQTAQETLQHALLNGGDTVAARQAVREAEQALERAQETVAAVQAQLNTIGEARLDHAARTLRESAERELAEVLAQFDVSESGEQSMQDIQLNDGLAKAVENARQALAAATARLQEAAERAGEIAGRVAALERERRDIISQRAAGHMASEQEARLVVLSADLEGLRPLLVEAEQMAAALEPVNERQALQHFEALWRQHKDEAAYQTLATQVVALERKLIDAVGGLQAAGIRAGKGNHLSQSWRASRELQHLVSYGQLPGRV